METERLTKYLLLHTACLPFVLLDHVFVFLQKLSFRQICLSFQSLFDQRFQILSHNIIFSISELRRLPQRFAHTL